MLIFMLCINIFCVGFFGYYFVKMLRKDWGMKKLVWLIILLALIIDSAVDIFKVLGEI